MFVLDAKGWTEWGAWSQCSATCGMSLKERTRQCDDHTCKGESIGMAKCVVPQCVAAEPGKDKITDPKNEKDQIPDYKDKGELVISSSSCILLNISRYKDLLETKN